VVLGVRLGAELSVGEAVGELDMVGEAVGRELGAEDGWEECDGLKLGDNVGEFVGSAGTTGEVVVVIGEDVIGENVIGDDDDGAVVMITGGGDVTGGDVTVTGGDVTVTGDGVTTLVTMLLTLAEGESLGDSVVNITGASVMMIGLNDGSNVLVGGMDGDSLGGVGGGDDSSIAPSSSLSSSSSTGGLGSDTVVFGG